MTNCKYKLFQKSDCAVGIFPPIFFLEKSFVKIVNNTWQGDDPFARMMNDQPDLERGARPDYDPQGYSGGYSPEGRNNKYNFILIFSWFKQYEKWGERME